MGFLSPTTILLLIVLAILVVTMILSGVSASEADQKNYVKTRHYSIAVSIFLGFSILFCFGAILLYAHREQFSKALSSASQVFSESF